MYIVLDETILPEEEACVPLDDRGLRYGDGIFETIRICQGQPYLWDAHLRRLKRGLQQCQIAYKTGALKVLAGRLIQQNHIQEGVLRLMITRGSGGRGYLPDPESNPRLVMETFSLPSPPAQNGEHQLALSNWRRFSEDILPTQAKLMQGMNATLARMEAAEAGAYEALQLSTSGHVCEASSSNIFWYRNKTLYTPGLETGCLPGITRQRLTELSPYRVKAGRFKLKELLKAEAVFLTNSVHLTVAVHSLQQYSTNWTHSDRLAELHRTLFLQDMENSTENSMTE